MAIDGAGVVVGSAVAGGGCVGVGAGVAVGVGVGEGVAGGACVGVGAGCAVGLAPEQPAMMARATAAAKIGRFIGSSKAALSCGRVFQC
jgi:hypothetical protein